MRPSNSFLALLVILSSVCSPVFASPGGAVIREAAQSILQKFGKGVAGQTVDEVADATTKAILRHGDEALPLLRSSGHTGFAALEEAGEKAPDVIKLYARKGDEAIWVISQPKKLAIFLKHGDSAADALIKHPGIADSMIERFGDGATAALNNISRQSAQRLSIVADEGLLAASSQSSDLLGVVRRYGDEAMDFIWKNKGSLAVASVLATFLVEPELYIKGTKDLIVDPLVAPIMKSVNWTLIFVGVLIVLFMPYIAGSLIKTGARLSSRNRKA